MRTLRVAASCAVILLGCAHATPVMDLDLDGIEDRIDLSVAPSAEPPEVDAQLLIELSSRSEPISIRIMSATGNIGVYGGGRPGDLIVDYTNRSSRDNPELVYNVYRWDVERVSFCLHASVDGTPPNQLLGQHTPSNLRVVYFAGCSELGDEEAEPVQASSPPPLRRDDVAALSSKDLSEWVSSDISARVTDDNMSAVLRLADEQVDRGNPIAAVIVFEAILRHSPSSTEARDGLERASARLNE